MKLFLLHLNLEKKYASLCALDTQPVNALFQGGSCFRRLLLTCIDDNNDVTSD